MSKKIKVGIIGCGAIGSNIARFIDTELEESMRLVGVYDIDTGRVNSLIPTLSKKTVCILPDRLIDEAELVIEAAQIDVAREVIEKAVEKNKDVVILSVGVFVQYPQIVSLIQNYKGIVYVPSGAICGLDGLSSLRRGGIKRIVLTTSKPPRSLTGVAYLKDRNIDVLKIKEETVVFKGDINGAIEHFPRNINVAAAIFLASQFANIEVVVKVDPNLERNTHRIEVDAEAAHIVVEVANIPSPENPKTSYLTILATQNLLQKITSHIRVGS